MFSGPWLHTHLKVDSVFGLQRCDESTVILFALEFVVFCSLQAATLNLAISLFFFTEVLSFVS